MPGGTNDKNVDKYLESGKSPNALVKRLLCNSEFFVLVEPFVQKKTIDAFANHLKVVLLHSTSMITYTEIDADIKAGANLVQQKHVQTSSDGSSNETYEVHNSC